MSNMITIEKGFQYSVNIGYDLHSDDKLQSFIPTKSSLSLISDIINSTSSSSTNRARILIGAYGKGKSHIVLTILALLMKKDLSLFTKLTPILKEIPELHHAVVNYYESKNKILPVVITGSGTSITQAFLLALQRSLSDNDLMDIMPDSNYQAAVKAIELWKKKFPSTYKQLQKSIDIPVKALIERLNEYDMSAYEMFEKAYPTLTSGSVFNPFLGFDVVELYESVVKALKTKGYSGVYVVYDEFSKYLEANITRATAGDVKMLQDFAEKCNRSGNAQMHIMLISHKEISNYIDKLPRQKVDGWRGVSERFTHIHLSNNFSQTYEVIASVIKKNKKVWNSFCKKHDDEFNALVVQYDKHPSFKDVAADKKAIIYGGYPLHPSSMFILPRLSEKVAQNERTLFTFLSAEGTATLSAFIGHNDSDDFCLLTPDIIYDYFEPLFKKEAYSSVVHSTFVLTELILAKIDSGELETKIVKTISLLYILEQFDRLSPTVDELVAIYSSEYTTEEIRAAIDNLIEKKYVVYLKRSNGFLRLKNTSGVDVKKAISDKVQSDALNLSVKDGLALSNLDNYLYPSRYNDEHEMTRFFSLEFLEESEVNKDTDWELKTAGIKADGVIFAIIPSSEESIDKIGKLACKISKGCERCVFIVPKHYVEIEPVIRELQAVSELRTRAENDPVLFEEYDVIYEDLNEIVRSFVSSYIHPDMGKSKYIYLGRFVQIFRKAALSALLSQICDRYYSLTPVINNEAVNKEEITTMASNSRNKIIAALLRSDLESSLGFSGTTQEVSIMRSTLIRTGILVEENGAASICTNTGNDKLDHLLNSIEDFVYSAKRNGSVSFGNIYNILQSPTYRIGLRKGLIPIYLAAVLHNHKQEILVSNSFGQLPLSADTLLQINSDPDKYFLSYVEWNQEREEYLCTLSKAFSEYTIEADKRINTYDYAANAIKRWYMSLPKYSKDCRVDAGRKAIPKRYISMINLLRQNLSSYDFLFKRIPEIFGFSDEFNPAAADLVRVAKDFYDELLNNLKTALIQKTKQIFAPGAAKSKLSRCSLSSICKDWCETLSSDVYLQTFPNGTERCLSLLSTSTNDEDLLISRLAKLCTDLRLEDWTDDTINQFESNLKLYKQTAEEFHSKVIASDDEPTSTYQITFLNDNGDTVTKRFDRVEYSNRGKLLMNQVKSALEAMGQSITEQEKRQVLMEILKQMF